MTRPRPLTGLRVLDLSRLLPGAFLTDLLVGLGADVLKVEAPDGDGLRHLGPDVDGHAFPMWALTRGKRSAVIDLKAPGGADALLGLVAEADVLVESFRPGVVDRLGVGYDACREVNPRIVFLSLCGYDPEGPDARAAGHDINFLARAGVLSLNDGGGAGELRPLPVPFADLTSSLTAGMGLLAAVLQARESGVGDRVSVAMGDVAANLVGVEMHQHLATHGEQDPAAGALSGVLPCYSTYACRDGRWLAVGALEPKFWAAFCDAVGHPEFLSRQHDPTLRPEVAAAVAAETSAHWHEVFSRVDACTTIVATLEEAVRSFATPSPDGTTADLPTPFVVGGRRLTREGRPPYLGEHTQAALGAATGGGSR
jgi:alpha-methylacyl-CoA racemase